MPVVRQYIADDDIKSELGIFDFIDDERIYKNICHGYSKKIYVKDFGAKGDGIKNDSSAIKKALTVLRRSPMGTTLVFEENKTYYISSGQYAIDLKDLEMVNIQGNNCTILVKPIMSFCRINNCKNVEINGIKFDYKTKPYAVAEVTNVFEDGMIRIKTDRSLNIRGTYKQPVPEYFGLVDRPDSRYHIGISTYKVFNRDHFLYDVKCNNMFADRDKRIAMLKDEKYKFIVPMPHVGHVIEHAIDIENNKNILIKDCTIVCAAKYMFFVRANDGFIYFKNIKVDDDKTDESISIVGWRDGFYCKDNRAKIVWDGCKVHSLCDDILHITSTSLKVQQIQEKVISLCWDGESSLGKAVRIGDEITFFNIDTGDFLGDSIIQDIDMLENHINVRLADRIEKILTNDGCRAVITSLTSPGAVVKNCDFHGTFRLESSLYAVKSNLHLTRMWTDIKTGRDDLLGKNILFSNCVITFDKNNDKYVHIDTNNLNWKNSKSPYCMGDVVFYNCKMKKSAVQMGEVEKKNSVVRFIECHN